MDMKIARKFAALVAKKKEAEAELKDAREAMAELEPLILQMLTDEGLKDLKLTVSGMSITLYQDDAVGLPQGRRSRSRVQGSQEGSPR